MGTWPGTCYSDVETREGEGIAPGSVKVGGKREHFWANYE